MMMVVAVCKDIAKRRERARTRESQQHNLDFQDKILKNVFKENKL